MPNLLDKNLERQLLHVFREVSGVRAEISDEALFETDYFVAGYIDSFGIINLIAGIETAFGFRFAETDFQDRRFARLDGIAAIIREKDDG